MALKRQWLTLISYCWALLLKYQAKVQPLSLYLSNKMQRASRMLINLTFSDIKSLRWAHFPMLNFRRQPNTPDALEVGLFLDACLFVKAQKCLHKWHLYSVHCPTQEYGYVWAEDYLLTRNFSGEMFPVLIPQSTTKRCESDFIEGVYVKCQIRT